MTLTEFKAYVGRDFKRTDKETEKTQAYNDMQKWLAAKMPIGDYKFQSYVPTSAGVEDYEIPCDAMHILHPIKLLLGSASGDSGYPLNHITKEAYDIREPNPNRNNPQTSRPSDYTIFSRSILLLPPPDSSSYLLEINWSQRPADQVVGTDTINLGSEFDQILKWGALERLYEGMQRYEEALYWASKYKDGENNPAGMLKDLLREETAREGNAIGMIRANYL